MHAGNTWIAPDAHALLQNSSGPELTQREVEVLSLMAKGLRNREIAHRLGLSLNTVKAHMQSILLKLDAKDRTEAAVIALRRGIVHLS